MIFLIFFNFSVAATTPGFGSSIIGDPEKSLFWKLQGLSSQALPNQLKLESVNEKENGIEAFYKTENQTESEYSLQFIPSKEVLTSKDLIRKYNLLGFEVLGNQTQKAPNKDSAYYLFDLKLKDQKLRQKIQFAKGKMLVLTCKSKAPEFKNKLPVCNQFLATEQIE